MPEHRRSVEGMGWVPVPEPRSDREHLVARRREVLTGGWVLVAIGVVLSVFDAVAGLRLLCVLQAILTGVVVWGVARLAAALRDDR